MTGKTHNQLIEQGYKTYSDIRGWEKSYIFLRWMVNKDRFGGLSDNRPKAEKIVEAIYKTTMLQKGDDDASTVAIAFRIIESILVSDSVKKSNRSYQYENLLETLKPIVNTPDDLLILAITIEELLLPTNQAVAKVPAADEIIHFARLYGKALLDEKKELGLSSIFRDWDLFTEALSLNKEREIIVDLVANARAGIRRKASKNNLGLTDYDMDVLLTGLCQEFERRTGQKRKQRAGDDLEGATQFVFNYYGLKASEGPSHLTTGLEVDTWVKDKRGWYIGISLKRTIRERWKQTFISVDDMKRIRIKNIVHIVNNDSDLSDNKIAEMAGHQHLFFINDNSRKLVEMRAHPMLSEHVFEMSKLISQLNIMIKS